jgi:carboxyl-terminal processing protease
MEPNAQPALPIASPTEPATEPATPAPEASPSPLPASPAPRRRRGRIVRRLAAGTLVVALAAGVFGAGVAVDRTGLLGGPAAEVVVEDAEDFALVREAWNLLHERYVGAADLESRDLAHSAIEGLTEAIDDPGHSGFMTPEERERQHESLSGSFVGVGIQVDPRTDGVTIVGVMRDSPAEAAGLRRGDRIVAVDGTPIAADAIDRVVELVRGEAGTSVTLTLARTGASTPLDVTMERAEIELPAVTWAPVPGTSVAMLRLEQFSSGSAAQLTAALDEILATEPSGIVLDLRGNPGGYVNEAVTIASQFLTEGHVHLSRDARGVITPTPVAPDGVATEVPLVVLVDEGSASSAEIVTGALQDAGRAPIVGRRTFGTGTVVSETPLSDGSALRIGVIEWLTPQGRSIWREGIAPDHSVTLPVDVAPLVPEELEGMGPHAVARSGDAQLLRALELLEADLPAPRG